MDAKEKAALAAQIAATLLAEKIDLNTLSGPGAEKKSEDALGLAHKIIAKSCAHYRVG